MQLKTFSEKGPGDLLAICPANRAAWRKWLAQHHVRAEKAWLILYRKHMGSDLDYAAAVEEALCFGWIDSKGAKRDEDTSYLYMARRKPRSGWSASNKARVDKLMAAGLMMPAGLAVIELAKQNGAWSSIDAAEAGKMPPELAKALSRNKKARAYFEAFPPGVQRAIFQWISTAKTSATIEKRVTETVTLAEKNIRANQWRPGAAKK